MIADKIVIEWVGFRKDAGKGSFWGYFIPANQPTFTTRYYSLSSNSWVEEDRYYYKFFGKIGKTITIEKGIIGDELHDEMDAKKKNFREIEPARFYSRCGSVIAGELEMQVSVMILRGEIPQFEPKEDEGW